MPPRRRPVSPVTTAPSEDRETIDIDIVDSLDSDQDGDNPSLQEQPQAANLKGTLLSSLRVYLTNPHYVII